MKRLMLLVALTLGGGCFGPDKPTCSYSCGDVEPRCPTDYDCREDGYCHLTGTTAACGFPEVDMSLGPEASDLGSD